MICPSCQTDHPRTHDLLTCAKCGADLYETVTMPQPCPVSPCITDPNQLPPAVQRAIARRDTINYARFK